MATATATTTHREPLNKEAQHHLALSIMAYLYSDLRSLSATGFTKFPFEKIALLRCDNQGSKGRLTGEILMSALAELRRESSKDKEGLFQQLANKEDKEHDSDNSLLPALELLVQISLKDPGNEVALCPIDAKPFKYDYEAHQHVGSCDQCLCYRYGMHYSQTLVDHLLISEEEKEKQEQEDAKSRPPPPNLIKSTYEQHFDNSVPPTTKEDALNDEKLNQSLAENTRSDWLASQFDPESPLGNLLSHDSELVLVNDKYPEIECVYAIAASKSKKLVTVTFRGTVNITNWIMNFRSRLMDRPNPVQTEYPDREDTIEIHTGFSEYLLRRRLDNGKTKFDEIVQCVHDTANELGGSCRLHVTGHSLGGALATIFALYASALPGCASKEYPIKLFTFASPYTGGTSFAKAFQHQEQAGLLMHARFQHEYDIIPRIESITTWHPSGTEYLHTGLRVTLHHDTKKLPSLFFLKDFSHNSLLRQRLGNFVLFHLPWFQLWNLTSFHELRTYSNSLVQSVGANSKANCKKSLEDLYELSLPNVNNMEPGEKKRRYFSIIFWLASVSGCGLAVLLGFLWSSKQ